MTSKRLLAAAGAALAAVIVAVVIALALPRGSGPLPSVAACRAALAAQLAASEAGSQAARNAPLPAQCSGLPGATLSSIAADVVATALASYMGSR